MATALQWTDESIGRFWAYHGRFPETYFSYGAGRDVVRRARRFIPKRGRVLDFGCGPGFLLEAIIDAGYIGMGSEVALSDYTERRFRWNPNYCGIHSIESILDSHESFDAVFASEVIEHLDDAALGHAIKSILAVLKPNGVLVITTPNKEDLTANTVYCPVSDTTFHRWQHVRSWSQASLCGFLREKGCSILLATETSFNVNTDTWLMNKLRRASYALRGQPNLFVIARKE